jgi:hypothetical protein
LIRVGGFGNAERLGKLLVFLDQNSMPAGTYDGLFAGLATNGFKEAELTSAIDLNLIEMHSANCEASFDPDDDTEVREWFELTKLGREALESINGKSPVVSI